MHINNRRLIQGLSTVLLIFTLLSSALSSANLIQQPAVDQILLTVTVNDKSMNPCVKNLTKEDFALYADKKPVEVTHFSQNDVPVSMGIIFDTSTSLTDLGEKRMAYMRDSLLRFIQGSTKPNEYFLYAIGETPRMLADWTTDTNVITTGFSSINFKKEKGSTAFYDTCYLSLEKVLRGNHAKRVIILISDGQDNISRRTYPEVRDLLMGTDVLLYAIFISTASEVLTGFGHSIFGELTSISGGGAFFPTTDKDLDEVFRYIAAELSCHYTIGFKPPDTSRDGKWHKLQLKFTETKGSSASDEPNKKKLKVRARQGYILKSKEQMAK